MPSLLRASSIATLPGIRHAFFSRHGGVSNGVYYTLNGGLGSRDVALNVRENRARMALALGCEPQRLITAYQVHSADAIVAEAPWARENVPRADAVATRVKGLAVAVTTADCGPILFADPEAGVIAAAHAGWKGALAGILEAAIAAMEQLGAARARMRVALGPMIRQPSYEVGPEFMARFIAADPDNRRFFAPGARQDHAQFDLAGYIVARLTRSGVATVQDLGYCTYADPTRFFSYRRATHRAEADYGRHISAIALVDT
jgi:polyphenol oxidase